MLAALCLLLCAPSPQGPGVPDLTLGVLQQGEITADDPRVEDPATNPVQDQTFLPVRVRRYRFTVPADGVYFVAVEAKAFSPLVVVRDAAGAHASDWIPETEGLPRLQLAAGETRLLDCGSTFDAVGAFTVQVIREPGPSLAEQVARLRELLAWREQHLGAATLQVATTWDALGRRLFDQSQYADALACMQRAQRIWTEQCGVTSVMAAYGHSQVASQLQRLDRLGEAREQVLACLAIRERLLGLEHRRTLGILNMLGSIEQQQGDLAGAIARFERVCAAAPSPDFTHRSARVTACHNLAHATLVQGRFTAARELGERALSDAEALHGSASPMVSWSLLTLASIEKNLGHSARAEALARRAWTIRRDELPPDHVDTATALNDLAVILARRGRAEEAAERFAEALGIYRRRLGEHWFVAVAQGNLGDALRAAGRLDDAERELREALALLDRLALAEHPGTATILQTLASVDRARGRVVAAEDGLRRAIVIKERARGALHPETLFAGMQLGLLLRHAGRIDEAAALYPVLREKLLAVHGPDHPAVHTMAEGLAILYATTGRRDEALSLAVEAVEGRFRHLAGELVASSSEDRFRDAAALQQWLDVLQTLAGDGPDAAADTAFEWSVATKGIVHRHVLRQREQFDAGLTDAQRALRSRLEECRASLAKLAYAVTSESLEAHRKRLAALLERKQALEAELGTSLGIHVQHERLATADLAALLPADAALLDFRFHSPYRCVQVVDGKVVAEEGREPERVSAWIVRSGDPHARRVDLGPAEPIRRAVEALLQDLAPHRGRAPRDAGAPSPNDALRALLWDPLAGLLAGRQRIFVGTDGELTKVPFAALRRADGSYLLEAHAFVCVQDVVTLARSLRSPPPARAPAPSLLALGGVVYDAEDAKEQAAEAPAAGTDAADAAAQRGGFEGDWIYLTATRAEIDALAAQHRRRFAAAARLSLSGSGATKVRLVAEAPRFHILHLATHGFFEPAGLPSLWEQALAAAVAGGTAPTSLPSAVAGYPPGLLAGLVLAGANVQATRAAGILTAEEVYGLGLGGCELVVMSACETALGAMRGGEGMVSLRRAFHEAGARTVVASLWKIHDEATASLMRSMYGNLWERGLPPADALRQAQLAMLGLNRLRRDGDGVPSTWGAFVVSGEWR